MFNFLEDRRYPATPLRGTQQIAGPFILKRLNGPLEPIQCSFRRLPDSYRLMNNVDCVPRDAQFQSNWLYPLPFSERIWSRGVRATLGHEITQTVGFSCCHTSRSDWALLYHFPTDNPQKEGG